MISFTTVDVATRERVTTPMEPFPGLDHVRRLRVSPDMRRVLYNSVPGPEQEYTWLAPPDGTDPQLQPDMSGGCCGYFELKGFEWGPESRQVLYPYGSALRVVSFGADNVRERTVASIEEGLLTPEGEPLLRVPRMELGRRCGPRRGCRQHGSAAAPCRSGRGSRVPRGPRHGYYRAAVDGTASCGALVLSREGRPLGHRQRANGWDRPRPRPPCRAYGPPAFSPGWLPRAAGASNRGVGRGQPLVHDSGRSRSASAGHRRGVHARRPRQPRPRPPVA